MKNLKKITAILLLCLAVVSCSSDDEGTQEPTNEDLVIGLWQIQSSTQDGNPVTLGSCDLLSTIRFTESGMFTQTFYTGTNCSTVTPQTGSYTLEGDNITVNQGSSATIIRIVTLNESNLSVEFNFSGVLKIDNYIKQ
ncbi:hypothetical protein ULMS_16410 [Patiriisocius marinistellae]|uniref:Lipocalin-like domain-containing protein n=1 Tax=Patiriisocius marinistellae TaxID=2494560 RepID=A0A5J4FW39_9FLAO|nr:lipocalin family protein [Patiriisocius marinistellae]GEQ86133.1 hypothetical protein ULMS_16410 [Patiriisocius marinistellae]